MYFEIISSLGLPQIWQLLSLLVKNGRFKDGVVLVVYFRFQNNSLIS